MLARGEPVQDRSGQGHRGGGRAPWGSLSREEIIRAAELIVVERGLHEVSVRKLAAELGVAPMSIYRHVSDKDDLLNAVVDRLLRDVWQPNRDPGDWRGWIIEAADKLRRFLVEQPAALHVYLHHPVVSTNAVARMNAMMDVLRDALRDEACARSAYAAIHTHTIGFAALEATRNASRDHAPPTTPKPAAPADELSRQLASYTTETQFVDSLNYLLNGIY
jgi:AcrR family transcriptional regulator